jgi:hypothetical protein
MKLSKKKSASLGLPQEATPGGNAYARNRQFSRSRGFSPPTIDGDAPTVVPPPAAPPRPVKASKSKK